MALSTTGLRDRIKTKLDSAFGATGEPLNTYRLQFALAVAEAVVEEIQANGKAQIGTGLGALQREVNNLGNTVDTTAPSATREIPLV